MLTATIIGTATHHSQHEPNKCERENTPLITPSGVTARWAHTFGSSGMLDGLHRLVHDAIVGRHHKDDNVSGVGSTGSDGGEGSMPRSVQEGDPLACGQLDCKKKTVCLLFINILLIKLNRAVGEDPRGAFLPRKAPMCCVIPPASVETIWLFLRLSNRVVLP